MSDMLPLSVLFSAATAQHSIANKRLMTIVILSPGTPA
jgi:hypothetical protein